MSNTTWSLPFLFFIFSTLDLSNFARFKDVGHNATATRDCDQVTGLKPATTTYLSGPDETILRV